MSRKIRVGNDIDINWSLLDKDEQPYIVEGRTFRIELLVGSKRVRIPDATADGNRIHFVYYGKDQKNNLGSVNLIYIENDGVVDMVTFDTKDAFTMVPHSWLAVDSDEHQETITLEVVTVLSNLQSSIGPRGYSAYEIAVHHGYTGTEEEWLDSLKPHITADADGNVYCDGVLLTDVIYRVVSAVTVDEQARQEAETARQAAENARVEAEELRRASENERVDAETARQEAEITREAVESERQIAENIRQMAETQRSENETARQSQETARQNAEQTRQSNESTRQSQETARENAEQNRTTEFNGLKSDMQTAIQQMGAATETVVATNEGIQQNETARQQAESGRVEAETARQSAEQTRSQNEQTRQTQEGLRQTAETTRQTQETARQTAEGQRATAEEGRATAESGRVSAEESRVAAETARESQSTSDHQRAESDHTRAEEDHERIADKADVDGYYSGMTVGLAENLIDTKGAGTEQSFVKRTSCGDQSIADDGAAIVQRFFGKSFVWNQLVRNGNFASADDWTVAGYDMSFSNNVLTLTKKDFSGTRLTSQRGISQFIAGHKFFVFATVKVPVADTRFRLYVCGADYYQNLEIDTVTNVRGIVSGVTTGNAAFIYPDQRERMAVGQSCEVSNVGVIDLTLMFGAGNEPATVEEFEAWLRSNIGIAPYYGYTPGMLMANKVAGIRTIGFNRYNHATGTAELVKYDNGGNPMYQITGEYTALSFTDALGNTITPEVDAEGYFDIPEDGVLSVTGGNDTDTCVHLCWSGYRDGEYEKYWEESRVKELTELKGKLNGAGESVVVFPDGLKSVGSARDEIVGNKAIKRVGVVDLGTLNWTYYSAGYLMGGVNGVKRPLSQSDIPNLLCGKYTSNSSNHILVNNSSAVDKSIGVSSYIDGVLVRDSAYTDAATFKSAMDGVLLYYELAEPEEYILDEPFNTTYKVADFGTEEIIPSGLDANLIPKTAPFTAIVKYNDDFTRQLATMPEHYVQRENVKQATGNSETDVLSQKAVEDNYAHKTGYEPGLGVGAADNITGKTNTPAMYRRRTAGGTADIGSGAAAIARMKGRTMVWNQLVRNGNFVNGTENWKGYRGTLNAADGVASITAAGTGNTFFYQEGVLPDGSDHLFLMLAFVKASIEAKVGFSYWKSDFLYSYITIAPDTWTKLAYIGQKDYGSGVTTERLCIVTKNADGTPLADNVVTQFKSIICIDLTLLFGAGNEPETVAEFEAMFPLPYYDYSEPKLVSNKAESIKTVGFNQWDEEWEVGAVNLTTGANSSSASQIRSKNYIPVFGGFKYCITTPQLSNLNSSRAWCAFYDVNKQIIDATGIPEKGGSSSLGVSLRGEFTVPTNAYYMRFYMQSAYGVSYKNDICINLSWSGYRNGEYEPYWESLLPLNLAQITGKLNGEGESVVIFPDGLRSAGTVFDELVVDNDGVARKAIKRIGDVDLGTLDWYIPSGFTDLFRATNQNYIKYATINLVTTKGYVPVNKSAAAMLDKEMRAGNSSSNLMLEIKDSSFSDAATFKSAMDGAILYHEKAVYEEYILDTPIAMNYRVDDFGTEERLPADTTESVLPEIDYDVKYSINARDTLRKLPETFVPRTEGWKYGVVSQTQTWSGGNTGFTYTMSNKVMGWIPNSNIDLYQAAGALFNPTTGYFELNGLTDISYNEMAQVYRFSFGKQRGINYEVAFSGLNIRTNFPLFVGAGNGYSSTTIDDVDIRCMAMAARMSVFAWSEDENPSSIVSRYRKVKSTSYAFRSEYIKTVIGIVNFSGLTTIETSCFLNAYSLENFKAMGVKANVVLSSSPNFSLASVVFMVQNCGTIPTGGITITLHATAYARCVADTTEYTYNEQTYTGIIALAAAKNITIQQAS